MASEAKAPNVEAILNWTRNRRPDLVPQIEKAVQNDALMALLSIGFEAGRVFQDKNPGAEVDFPLDLFATYNQ